jgi:uncharacterized cupin superfamily protein
MATAKRKEKARPRAKQAARKTAPARRPVSAKARLKAAKPRKQTFVASHLDERDFKEGLRSYAKYRDLGMAAATNGLAQAHVIRLIPPCDPAEVSKRHFHDVEFQMIYVLKGWFSTQFEGHGTHTFRAGSCWIQPPRIKHTVMGYSDDCELLEIVSPAQFETVEFKS